MERSAAITVVVTGWLVLLFRFESNDVLATVAVLVTLAGTGFGMLYVDVIVTDWPLVIAPIVQGYAVVQPPALDTNVNPVGVGSVTTTRVAGAGPSFVTVI